MRFRVGLGFDIHPFGDGSSAGPLVLGGVAIDGAARLAGHSDGDAIAHAVSDAILGAAGLPDLGTLYPATDEQWRDADSMAMLREVAERVAHERWWVGNVDVVVAAETPQLAPYIEQMHANISAALERSREPMGEPIMVSIKPKRGEGLGAIGRAEGIAVWAIVSLGR
jgi:2-C-methyl-D-erythritol 2,4-cyclodiphosphate synthase